MKKRGRLDKVFKDSSGRVVIAQKPNWPLIAFIIFTILGKLLPGTVGSISTDIGRAALMYWAVLELLQGVNYFRRILGLAVALSIIVGILKA